MELIVKTPHDGLGDLTDEHKLGVTYKDIHDYIRNNGENLSQDVFNKIQEKEKYSKHKFNLIPIIKAQ